MEITLLPCKLSCIGATIASNLEIPNLGFCICINFVFPSEARFIARARATVCLPDAIKIGGHGAQRPILSTSNAAKGANQSDGGNFDHGNLGSIIFISGFNSSISASATHWDIIPALPSHNIQHGWSIKSFDSDRFEPD